MIQLHDFELDDRSYAVRLLLSALGIGYEKVPVNMFPGRETEAPAFLALNPLGTLPVLVDGARVVAPAEAALVYLARVHDSSRRWLPDDPVAEAAIAGWLAFAARELDAARLARSAAMMGTAPPGIDEAALVAAARRALRLMDDHMTARSFDGGAWFVGDAPTIADIALFPAFALSRDYGVDHEAYPALRRWLRQLRAIPGFITMPGIPDYH